MCNNVLFSIHREHNEKIFSGDKLLEIRKTAPSCDYPYTGWIYEPKKGGGVGAIVGYFTCEFRIKTNVFAVEDPAAERYKAYLADRACLSTDQMQAYADGGTIYALGVSKAVRLPFPLPLSDLGIKRAPQSWQYLKSYPTLK